MTFYEDSTIANVRDIVAICSASARPLIMMNRFRVATADPDLEGLLGDMGVDYISLEVDRRGSWEANYHQGRIADALQGIEDQEQTAVVYTQDSDGGNLEVSVGGSVVVLP